MGHPGACPSQSEGVSSAPNGPGGGRGRTGCGACFAAAGGGCIHGPPVLPRYPLVPRDCQWSWSIGGGCAAFPASDGSAAALARQVVWMSPCGPIRQCAHLERARVSGPDEAGGRGGVGHCMGLQG